MKKVTLAITMLFSSSLFAGDFLSLHCPVVTAQKTNKTIDALIDMEKQQIVQLKLTDDYVSQSEQRNNWWKGPSKISVKESELHFYETQGFGSDQYQTKSFVVDRNTGAFYYDIKVLRTGSNERVPGTGWKVAGTCKAQKQNSTKQF